jgi:phosphoribosyl-ATP pyrophosphohydrolase/phosphoribosyl-AMP cyclohydrolase
MSELDIRRLDWSKGDGLLPAVIQDARTGRVLMLGYMNEESLRRTIADRRVTFFSRSRNQLWTKGETSGHFLDVVQVTADCDDDTILVLANAQGPTCHKGTTTCFADARDPDAARIAFLASLEQTIAHRIAESPEGSYTARLYASGIGRIAQKVGEEGVETALAAVTREDAELVGECADLLYHLLVMLKVRNLSFDRVVQELASRHASKPTTMNRPG